MAPEIKDILYLNGYFLMPVKASVLRLTHHQQWIGINATLRNFAIHSAKLSENPRVIDTFPEYVGDIDTYENYVEKMFIFRHNFLLR